MSKIEFSNLKEIKEFQFFGDSSGIILNAEGQLFRFEGNQTEPISGPEGFQPSQMHFVSQMHGAVIGNAKVAEEDKGAGNSWEVWMAGGVLLLFVLLFALFNFLLKKLKISKILRFSGAALLSLGLMVGTFFAVFDPTGSSEEWKKDVQASKESPYISTISSDEFYQKKGQTIYGSGHHYGENMGQKSFAAFTKDGGKTWQTEEVKTNFYLSAIGYSENRFLIGSYADSMHHDGDIYIYADSAGTYRNTAVLDFSRATHGFAFSEAGKTVFIFGTEAQPSFPAAAPDASKGNIIRISSDFKAPYSLIDAPDSAAVRSLSVAGDNSLWISLDEKAAIVGKNSVRVVQKESENKRLFCLNAQGEWEEKEIEGEKSFEQIMFLPQTSVGYALAANRKVFETKDNGRSWQLLDFEASKVNLFQNKAAFLQNGNRLFIYPSAD